jgi:RNA polymerase sigma factor (sigma-70 family)
MSVRVPDSTDAELVRRLPGDPASFEELFRRHGPSVIAYAARRCSQPADVADLVAATFLAVLESRGGYDPVRGAFGPWLIGVAHRQYIALRREEYRQWSLSRAASGRRVLGDEALVRLEERIDAARESAEVEHAMKGLAPRHREVLWPVGRDALTPHEAAQALGVNAGAFRVRRSQGAPRSPTRSHAHILALPKLHLGGTTMICDERGAPLDEFETAMLAELLAAQDEFITLVGEGGLDTKVVTFGTPRRHRRRVLAVVGVAAALVALAAALGITRHGGTASATPALPQPLAFSRGTHAAAIAFLAQAANLQNASPQTTGPVLYTKTQDYALSTSVGRHLATTVVSTTIRQVWEAATGTVVKEYTQDTWPAGGDVGGPKAVGGIDHTRTYKPGGWADDNAQLPTSSSAALPALRAEVAHSKASDSYLDAATDNFTIGDLVAGDLDTGTASPGQTAANYELLASAPGVFYAGQVTDNAGRTGEAVGVVVSDPTVSIGVGTEYFVIDPTAGAILEVEQVDTPNAPPGLHLPPGPTVQQYDVILASGHVSTTEAVPTNR